MEEDGEVILETGATANLARFRWLESHNSLLGKRGLPWVSTYPARARLTFRDGRSGEVRYAADITAGIAVSQGSFTAFVLDADTPALLRGGALEALSGQLDSPRDVLTLRSQGAGTPLLVDRMGYCVSSAVTFGEWHVESRR